MLLLLTNFLLKQRVGSIYQNVPRLFNIVTVSFPFNSKWLPIMPSTVLELICGVGCLSLSSLMKEIITAKMIFTLMLDYKQHLSLSIKLVKV